MHQDVSKVSVNNTVIRTYFLNIFLCQHYHRFYFIAFGRFFEYFRVMGYETLTISTNHFLSHLGLCLYLGRHAAYIIIAVNISDADDGCRTVWDRDRMDAMAMLKEDRITLHSRPKV